MKRLALYSTLFAMVSSTVLAAERTMPNIVVILADDLGYGDVQGYNPERGKIPTPNIDRLAAQGMRFTDAHSSSGVCSPSRYTLLTGRYHWRSPLQNGIVSVFGAPLIKSDRVTIGGMAREHGYKTVCIGKWHLGWNWPMDRKQSPFIHFSGGKDDEAPPSEAHLAAWREVFSKPIKGGPTAVGFDEYFGTDVPNWPPYCFIENDRTVGIPSSFLPRAQRQNHLADKPGPATKDWKLEAILPTLGQRASDYITLQTKKGQPFLLYMSLTSPHTPIAPTPAWKGKSGLGAYGDFVMQTDAVIGQVLDALEKSGAAGNTLVVFTSGNGCAPYIGVQGMEAKGHFPSGPLRGYKADVWEGGHRMPFIVRWPGVVNPGSMCGQLVQQADLMATFADVIGTKLPDNVGEDSFSILPLLKGQDKPVRENAVNCSIEGVPAIRQGSWKLILAPGSGGWSKGGAAQQPVQLYNLAEDLGETKNLAAEQPERVADMKALLEKLITQGRSTPGAPQKNDVNVIRYPKGAR
jgi:arylsulfatase A-like enzyme